MREYVLVTTADVPAERLWAVAADLRRWPDWQPRAEPGGTAWATPSANGTWSGLAVEETAAPTRLTAVAVQFLGRVRFEYRFEPCARGTRVRVAVALLGPLSFAYRRSFDRYLQRTLAALVARLIERAREPEAPALPEPAARTEHRLATLCEVHS